MPLALSEFGLYIMFGIVLCIRGRGKTRIKLKIITERVRIYIFLKTIEKEVGFVSFCFNIYISNQKDYLP